MIQKVDRASIKNQAKEQLRGKIWMTFLCILITGLISAAAGQVPTRLAALSGSAFLGFGGWVVYLAVMICVCMPLSVGLTKVYLTVTYGYKPSVATLFEPFSKYYGNSILTPLLVGLYEFLWYLPFLMGTLIIDTVIFVVMAAGSIPDILDIVSGDAMGLFGAAGKFIGAFLLAYLVILLLMIPYVLIINRYTQTLYVLAEYPESSATQCIETSKAMMKGRSGEFFVLNLSFIGWLLLVVVTFGIAYIYVGPYMSVTLANYYHRIKGGFVPPASQPAQYGQPPYGQPPYGGPAQQPPYGGPVQGQPQQPYGQSMYGQPPYGGPMQGQPQPPYGQAPYGAPVQNQAQPPYGAPAAPVAPSAPATGMAPEAPAAPVSADAPAFDAPEAPVVPEPPTESQQALDQVSHDMMTNFDDYIEEDGADK